MKARIKMYIGIDFGTSFSKAAVWDSDSEQPEFLLPLGEYGVPSDFYYDKSQGILIGEEADDAGQGMDAKNLKTGVKMDLSEDFIADGKRFTPEEIISEIYKVIIGLAQKEADKKGFDSDIEGAVISVPAKFTEQEKNLIKHAAEKAGIEVIGIIKEPVAAALAYYEVYANRRANHVLIFDLGGGTCDIALVEKDINSNPQYKVVDADMVRCGGQKWDERLTHYIVNQLESKRGVGNIRSKGYLEKIRRAAINVKERLSNPATDSTASRIEINGINYKTEILLSTFEEITNDLMERTITPLRSIYDKYAYKYDIQDIVCVGGSSNMKQVQKSLEKMFPDCDVHVVDPERAVVYGAAIYADKIKDNYCIGRTSKADFVQDIAAFSYGTNIVKRGSSNDSDLEVAIMIHKGDSLPSEVKRRFTTKDDYQTGVSCDIYEADLDKEYCEVSDAGGFPIAKMNLKIPSGKLKGYPIDMVMRLNRDGMLEVEAMDENGNHIETTININNLKR